MAVGDFDLNALVPDYAWGGNKQNWYKSARESKTNFLFDATQEALQQGAKEADRMATEEEARGAQGELTLRGAINAANVPTLTQQDINLRFGRAADTSGGSFVQTIGNLRSMLGENGLTGGSGFAGGLAAAAESSRLGSLIGARRDLFIEKANSDMTDRLNQYGRMTDLVKEMQRPVASERQDFLNILAGVRLSQFQGQMTDNAAKKAADAAKDASWLSFGSNILGSVLGAVL